jgi:hypothetical protein
MSNKKNVKPSKFSIAAKKAWKTRRKLYGPTGTPSKNKTAKKATAKRVSNATKSTKTFVKGIVAGIKAVSNRSAKNTRVTKNS